MVWAQGSAWHLWEWISNLYFFGPKLSRWQSLTSQVFARAPKQAVVSKCITTFTFCRDHLLNCCQSCFWWVHSTSFVPFSGGFITLRLFRAFNMRWRLSSISQSLNKGRARNLFGIKIGGFQDSLWSAFLFLPSPLSTINRHYKWWEFHCEFSHWLIPALLKPRPLMWGTGIILSWSIDCLFSLCKYVLDSRTWFLKYNQYRLVCALTHEFVVAPRGRVSRSEHGYNRQYR